jgi:hypothetical protein
MEFKVFSELANRFRAKRRPVLALKAARRAGLMWDFFPRVVHDSLGAGHRTHAAQACPGASPPIPGFQSTMADSFESGFGFDRDARVGPTITQMRQSISSEKDWNGCWIRFRMTSPRKPLRACLAPVNPLVFAPAKPLSRLTFVRAGSSLDVSESSELRVRPRLEPWSGFRAF